MRLPHNSNNLAYVRSLRKNMTDAERKLWYEYLRPCPYKFTRQKSVGPKRHKIQLLVLRITGKLKIAVLPSHRAANTAYP